jgi:hypothetical protein
MLRVRTHSLDAITGATKRKNEMINKRQLLLGAGSVLAASTLPAIAHKNANGVELKAIEHPKPNFEILYVPLEKSTDFRNMPCAVYREIAGGNGNYKAFLGRYNKCFNDDGTRSVGFKLLVKEEISFAAKQLETATDEQKDYVLKHYKENGMTVSEMPEAMLKKPFTNVRTSRPSQC